MTELTPMMRQYVLIKEQYADCILLYRLGDFYEMFFDDALLASRELEITLTARGCGLSERAPMCGVPYHAVDMYIKRLIERGHKVAICDQLEPAEKGGMMRREVTRVITPGTVTDAQLLEEKRNNYLLFVCREKNSAGIAYVDVSTGEFTIAEVDSTTLGDVIASIAPSEIHANDVECLHAEGICTQVAIELTDISFADAKKALTRHFEHCELESAEILNKKLCITAAGALIAYLTHTQKNSLSHITDITVRSEASHMLLDDTARTNLELVATLRGNKRGSLFGLMDKTRTAMGGRMLRSWIERPLMNQREISARQDALCQLIDQYLPADDMRDGLGGVYDIERLLSKIAYGSVGPRDALMLAQSLKRLPAIKHSLSGFTNALLSETAMCLDTLDATNDLLNRAISEDAPIALRDGQVIRAGYSAALDQLREAASGGIGWLTNLETREREATGIKNLKIGYNKVFGYYIEVTKSNLQLVPYRYQRKQTLANCERYITDEVKAMEETILGAQEKALRLELELFAQIRVALQAEIPRLKGTAGALKTLDALLALAECATQYGFVRPEIAFDGEILIENGRHPVIEQAMGDSAFVPNDTFLNRDERLMIITGPNMAGKSTYMRQVALIAILAQMGSFVPATRAKLPIFDRVFTRIGASDDLFAGQSTFMVEMLEMARILKRATSLSLLILDEIGRGTSTFDGLSIAWAIAEHIADIKRCGATALFATHYHELSELEGRLPGVINACMTALEREDDVIFLRKLKRGGADKSYGVAVAALAGLPKGVLGRAREIMAKLEVMDVTNRGIGQNILDKAAKNATRQVGAFDYQQTALFEEIRAMDVMSMSPLDALNALFLLREKALKIEKV